MCGICGELRFDQRPPDLAAIGRMMGRLQRRGPDHAGSHADGPLAFGHQRLAIIDLSHRASQPLVDAELGLALVFNGTIYNYPELRDELRAAGYHFFTGGDSEVIVQAYHAWGERCVERLHGMSIQMFVPGLKGYGIQESDFPAILAKAISGLAGKPFCPDLMVRTRSTPSQGRLTRNQRGKNVAGEFALNARRTMQAEGRRVLLIDDVLTTGATVSECAKVLKREKAKSIQILTLARVVRGNAITL